eukprot:TRINITY_DN4788_c0_g1_i1.p1 TRINITY_DN4788_c0_g1~~TRINITY_DN4788_c0_g1_i1.p1  ORF type:complete len:608 (+),score=105.14 TRINITY_DN4788_c0_g1_i1:44-1825(+)
MADVSGESSGAPPAKQKEKGKNERKANQKESASEKKKHQDPNATTNDNRIKELENLVAKLQSENEKLKRDNKSMMATFMSQQQKMETPRSKTRYHMSNNVVVIGSRSGKASRVPLLQLLADSQNRIDMREADTPTCGAINSQKSPRLSPGAVGDGPTSQPVVKPATKKAVPKSPASTPSEGSDSEPSSEPSTPSDDGKPKKRRPPALGKGVLNMGGNGIVSQQTLKVFQEQWGGGQSPAVSNVGDSILDYLHNSFAANGMQHSTRAGTQDAFGRHIIALCNEVTLLLKKEPLQVPLKSPIYVFGDIHGNFTDLHYFMNELVLFRDPKYTPHNFLFLGDYVDRGPHSVECVALLLALKVVSPSTINLIRGNHEDRMVNGDIKTYGAGSLKSQCHALFGPILGENVWLSINQTFKWLPLTAVIDDSIFCTHGGIPRYIGGPDHRMQALQDTYNFPRFETFFECGPDEPEKIQLCRRIAADCCWSDPWEGSDGELNQFGFGENPRGKGIVVFGSQAVDDFLQTNKLQYIFRAHQEKSDGLKVSKNARVVTIFSTSDYIGHQNGAGVVFVDPAGTIRLIIKEPKEDLLPQSFKPLPH